MRHLLLCAALVGCGAGGDAVPPVDLPVFAGSVASEPAGQDVFTVTLGADGRIFAQGRFCSLNGLAELLRDAVRIEPGIPWASTEVRLRIDRAAPWMQVQWLVAAVSEGNVSKARIAYDKCDLECRVWPAWLGCALPELSEGSALRMRIAVAGDGGIRCGRLVAGEATSVRAWVANARSRVRDETLAGIVADVIPEPNAPWGAVAVVYECLRAAGVKSLTFPGFVGAPEDVRRRERLPSPSKRENLSAEVGGLHVLENWTEGGFQFVPWISEDVDALPEPEPELPNDD